MATYGSTRFFYDPKEQERFSKNITKSVDYNTEKLYGENPNICYSDEAARNGISELSKPSNDDHSLNLGIKATTEDYLRNTHIELNSFNKNNEDWKNTELKNPNNCDESKKEHMVNQDSRFSNPIINYRELSTTSYNLNPHLHMSPQDVVANNQDTYLNPGLGTRQYVKDNKEQFKSKNLELNSENLLPSSKEF